MLLKIVRDVVDYLVCVFRRGVLPEIALPREQTHCAVAAYPAIANDGFDALLGKHSAISLGYLGKIRRGLFQRVGE